MDRKTLQLFDNVLVNLAGLRVDVSYLSPVDINVILYRAIKELSIVRAANIALIPLDLRYGANINPVLDGT
jgi:hypothetical protein